MNAAHATREALERYLRTAYLADPLTTFRGPDSLGLPKAEADDSSPAAIASNRLRQAYNDAHTNGVLRRLRPLSSESVITAPHGARILTEQPHDPLTVLEAWVERERSAPYSVAAHLVRVIRHAIDHPLPNRAALVPYALHLRTAGTKQVPNPATLDTLRTLDPDGTAMLRWLTALGPSDRYDLGTILDAACATFAGAPA